MFNSIIGSLASLLPKYFIFSSYMPVLIFGFINGALVVGTEAHARSLVLSLSGPGLVFATAVAFVLTVVTAYVLSSIATFLREVLEGKRLWKFLANPMRDRQAATRTTLDTGRLAARNEFARLLQAIPVWNKAIGEAGARGRASHPGSRGYDPLREPAGDELRCVQRTISTASVASLEFVVNLFVVTSARYDNKSDTALQYDYRLLRIVFEEVKNALNAKELEIYRDRHTRFGLADVAPTTMGNVAEALQGYTTSRYGFDLDGLWGRLMLVLQKNDEKGYGALLDAKTQLDFLIACTWLCGATTVVWALLLAVFSVSPWTFLAIAIAGAGLVALFYSLAVTNYLSYGSIVRATVDLNRFTLLRQLHVPLPSGIRNERVLWSGLLGLASFADPVDLSYEHPPQP